MKTLMLPALALGLCTSQAMALSCVAPDAARDFQRIASSETTYVVLKGSFDFAARPKRDGEQRPKTQSFAAKFSGTLLTGAGFTDDISDVLVTINSNCAGQWCGEIEPGADYIAFVEQDGRKLTLQANACPAYHFYDPNDAMIQQIEDCAAGRSCKPKS